MKLDYTDFPCDFIVNFNISVV